MKLKYIFFLSFFIFLSFVFNTSCKSGKYKEEINTIDSLITVLDTIEKKLNSIDTATTETNFKIYSNNIIRIRESFENKENDEVWQIITRYGLLRKPLRDFKKHYLKYSDEIEVSRLQLLNLKTDTRNNILSLEMVNKYINEEAVYVNYVKMSVLSLIENTQNYLNQFDELNPKVEILLSERKI